MNTIVGGRGGHLCYDSGGCIHLTCSMKKLASYDDPSDLHLLGRVQGKAIDSLERLVVH